MRKLIGLVLIGGAVALAVLSGTPPPSPSPPTPVPFPSPCPVPLPEPKPKPKPPPSPWGPMAGPVVTGDKPVEAGLVSPDGTEEVQIPLPEGEKKRNCGGSDGAGLCVFTSIEYCARWQNERKLFDFQAHMKKEPGGGYPEKVKQMMDKYAKGVEYLQFTDGDLNVLKSVLASGRPAGVTYNGHDCHYTGDVAHMVTLVHLTDKWACISDNNYPKDNQHVWLSPAAFAERWKGGGGGGWAVVLLRPPPPPPPKV